MSRETIEQRAEGLAEEFAFLPDWTGRYEYVIGMGEKMESLTEEEKNEETYVEGCQSDVWIRAELDPEEDLVSFTGDSTADITRGLTALLIRLLDRQPPDVIVEAELEVLDEIGLRDHLSAQRRTGLAAMIDQMKARAARFVPSE